MTAALLAAAFAVIFALLIRDDQQAAGPTAHDIDRHPSKGDR